MTNKHLHTVASLAIFSWGGAFFAYTLLTTGVDHAPEPAAVSQAFHESAPRISSAQASSLKRAERARERMLDGDAHILGSTAFDEALRKRNDLLTRSVSVQFVPGNASGSASVLWTTRLSEHPEWIDMETGWTDVDVNVNEELIADYVRSNVIDLPLARSGTITRTFEDKKVMRTDLAHLVKEGFTIDPDAFAQRLSRAFETGVSAIVVEAEYSPAVVQVELNGEKHELQLLASGVSNFENSPVNREANIHKALDEHINNIYVPAGGKFSFNDTLGGPVTLDKGWVEALGLFGGGAALTPGGGICQAATTVYRAAVLAGFPILQKRNHSLYVSYYEKYGVGMDATIFPGIHDLVFLNDTAGPLLIQARTVGDDAYVDVFGVKDDRIVSVEGPYFAGNRDRPKGLRALGYDEIGWVQSVIYADGKERVQPLISRYHKGFPGSVARTYGNGQGNDQLHAAATESIVGN